jgi:endonuclease YncB( thermonuclease family)
MTCRVASVTDGDTLRCLDGVRIRLHAVAARELDGSCSPGHPCPAASAEAATRELRRLAAGQSLSCSPTGRSYNRVTAICWTTSGTEINCAMVRSGTALLWTRFDREQPLCR